MISGLPGRGNGTQMELGTQDRMISAESVYAEYRRLRLRLLVACPGSGRVSVVLSLVAFLALIIIGNANLLVFKQLFLSGHRDFQSFRYRHYRYI